MECDISPKTVTNKKVKWSTSDPSVVTVSNKGVVTGISPSVAYITITADDGGKPDKCKVTVK